VHDAVAHTEVSPATEGPSTDVEQAGEPDAEGPASAGSSGASAAGDAGDGAPARAESHQVMVDEVMRAGYRWRGQVLRPAMVRVRG
jgi:hypothetical protein